MPGKYNPRYVSSPQFSIFMHVDALDAISPVDGRYRDRCNELAPFFSEGALIRYRIRIEIEYLVALGAFSLPKIDSMNNKTVAKLRNIYRRLDETGIREIKKIEKTTNHDVKAVEYYLRKQLIEMGLKQYSEFVHFGLTSQDINNTAVPLSIREALTSVYLPLLTNLEKKLASLAREWKEIPMLAHTHGQPASPTRLGKEMAVFAERIRSQRMLLMQVPHSAKFGGATGNFNAHVAAYPKHNWIAFADTFVSGLGLHRTPVTTQIEPYDNLAALFDAMKRINNVMLDLSRDAWLYISMNYFKQTIRKGETGSSTMPHKVNPIDFENAEGNLGMANAVFEHLSAKLPVSRLQRDLSDSTVLRNAGVPMAHTVIAFKSLLKGLNQIKANTEAINKDLEANWAVVAEGIQTILRREGVANAYESLKSLTRKHHTVGKKEITAFIEKLKVSPAVKKELRALTPFTYTGVFKR